jgi:hypothetical protein
MPDRRVQTLRLLHVFQYGADSGALDVYTDGAVDTGAPTTYRYLALKQPGSGHITKIPVPIDI